MRQSLVIVFFALAPALLNGFTKECRILDTKKFEKVISFTLEAFLNQTYVVYNSFQKGNCAILTPRNEFQPAQFLVDKGFLK